MENKRKDKNGRILKAGESQNKDGRYMFVYRDNDGKRKYVYSWRLTEKDAYPKGKRKEPSLREKEYEIQKNLYNNLISSDSNITVLDLVNKYLATKNGVRNSTKVGYKTVTNFLKKEEFAYLPISKVKMSDAKAFLIGMQKDGKRYSTIHNVRGVLKPAFQLAYDDMIINRNPFAFPLTSVIIDDSVRREAITPKQERQFLEFIKNDNHFSRYYDGIFFLLKTGVRISEFCGLTLNDIDLENRVIHITHQLQRVEMEYLLVEPKTINGVRDLPMSNAVYECCQRIVEKAKKLKSPTVANLNGFLFLDKEGKPLTALHWEKYFQHIIQKYNKIYKEELPKITPHVCRHTYITNMAMSGMLPKQLQYLAGHSDISTTLNIYTHVGFEDAKSEVERIEACCTEEEFTTDFTTVEEENMPKNDELCQVVYS